MPLPLTGREAGFSQTNANHPPRGNQPRLRHLQVSLPARLREGLGVGEPGAAFVLIWWIAAFRSGWAAAQIVHHTHQLAVSHKRPNLRRVLRN